MQIDVYSLFELFINICEFSSYILQKSGIFQKLVSALVI